MRANDQYVSAFIINEKNTKLHRKLKTDFD